MEGEKGPRSSSSSCSLNDSSKREDSPKPPSSVDEELGSIFGTESEDEPAASCVEASQPVGVADSGSLDRVQILPSVLEPPMEGFSEDGVLLPSEFELADPMKLKFHAETVNHLTKDVSLFAPGDLLDVEIPPLDETQPNGYIENGLYQKRMIRSRYNASGDLESNARVVEWDDGTMSLYVEGKWFDLVKESFDRGTELLCIDQQCCLQALHAVEAGWVTVAVPTDESDDGIEMETMDEPKQTVRQPKTKRVTVLGNPVKEREAKLKKIEEERRDRELMERKQRQLQEKYNLSGLEHLEEERDEEPATLPVKRTLSRQERARKRQALSEDNEDSDEEDEDEDMDFDERMEEDESEEAVESEKEEVESEGIPTDEPEPEIEPSQSKEMESVPPHRRTVVMTDEEDEDEDLSD